MCPQSRCILLQSLELLSQLYLYSGSDWSSEHTVDQISKLKIHPMGIVYKDKQNDPFYICKLYPRFFLHLKQSPGWNWYCSLINAAYQVFYFSCLTWVSSLLQNIPSGQWQWYTILDKYTSTGTQQLKKLNSFVLYKLKTSF